MKHADFAEKLLGWYRAHGRVLPWRSDPTPYRVLVSEFMLQQTRVDTVIPYFERFMERFPTLRSLAESDEEEALRFWQGLGYYSRARNPRKTAQKACEVFNGDIPQSPAELASLPGIGPYMEKAIRAFAFGLDEVPIDGNLMRVYSRLEAKAIYPDDPKAKKEAEAYFLERLSSPRDFGQALMDLGELACLPNGEPQCEECPFRDICKAHRAGEPLSYPLKKAKKASPIERLSVLLLLNGKGEIAIRKREGKGLLASMDEFPNVVGDEGDLAKAFGVKNLKYAGHAYHVFSHVRWEMDVYVGRGDADGFVYLPLDSIKEKAALPTAFAKLLTFCPAGR